MKKMITILMSSVLFLTLCPNCSNTKKEDLTIKKENQMTKTDSGLQYEILSEAKADAKMPTKGQRISAHYTGWLEKTGQPGVTASKFDSSVDRGQPLEFIVGIGQVIKGWDEGLLLMKVGEKRRLIVPANLAYGNRKMGNMIPANSTLIFDVELLAIK